MDKVALVHGNFGDVAGILEQLGVPAVDGMLFDLGGVLPPSWTTAAGAFPTSTTTPLDMRMDQSAPPHRL